MRRRGLNNDQVIDVVVTAVDVQAVYVLRGRGDGTFELPDIVYDSGSASSSCRWRCDG